MAGREGFEPSREFHTPYPLSRRVLSTTQPPPRCVGVVDRFYLPKPLRYWAPADILTSVAGLFQFGLGLSDLVTAIVTRQGGGWELVWAADGRAPRDFSDYSLTAVTTRASADVAHLYAGKSEAAAAELQFAIYPWEGDSGAVILDITGGAGGFTARDIQWHRGPCRIPRGACAESRTDAAQPRPGNVSLDPTGRRAVTN